MSLQQSFDRIAALRVDGRLVNEVNGELVISPDTSVQRSFLSRMDDGSPGFRITFSIDKISGPTPLPNPAIIKIYNVGATSRSILSTLNNKITLEAGYGTKPDLIFTGGINKSITQKQGPDYVTTIQAMDGIFTHQNSIINTSFDKGVTVNSVINTLVGNMGKTGTTPGQIEGVPSGATYNQGVVLTGKTIDRLREVCDRHDLQFSIQDEKVVILPYGANKGTPAVYLSPDTGLIGIPEIRQIDANSGNSLSFKCLMNPRIQPFQQILMDSKFVKGIYTCTHVKYNGDSWQGPWFCDVEASNQVGAL